MNALVAVIERPDAASSSNVVPVYGEAGIIGQAYWDAARGCHCLRLSLDEYQRHRRHIVKALGRGEQLSVDFEGGEPPPTDLEIILVDYQLEGETAERTLLRLLSHQTALQNWTPQKGRKPTLATPKPCLPHAS